ncbi:MAG: RNA 2',3'-cyclic phosphodiesterase [Chloroflexi bacterium]|nr:RNA 2',3'-cyclic phosphodiesterase [Chloroflexota bacterium]
MRLFIAIDLPDALKDRLERLKTNLPGASWTRRDTYHITLRFLGDDIAESRVPALQTALAAIASPDFDMTLQGVGRFPPGDRKPARVLWVGLAPNPPLKRLYRAVEQTVTAQGFPADDHDFSGHITLARLKLFQPDPAVDAFLARHAAFAADPFPAEAFHLVSSTLSPQGARYARLASFPLNRTP